MDKDVADKEAEKLTHFNAQLAAEVRKAKAEAAALGAARDTAAAVRAQVRRMQVDSIKTRVERALSQALESEMR